MVFDRKPGHVLALVWIAFGPIITRRLARHGIPGRAISAAQFGGGFERLQRKRHGLKIQDHPIKSNDIIAR